MSSFLTVEDINSNLLKYGDVNTLHSIDTSKISTDEFDSVMYDFCIVSHSIDEDDHTFSFVVRNNLWCGGYYFTDSEGNYLDVDASVNDKRITFVTSEESVVLYVYLTNCYSSFSFERLTWVSDDLKNLSLFYNSEEEHTFNVQMLDGSTATGNVLFEFGEYSAISTIVDGKSDYVLEDDGVFFNGVVKITFDGCSYYIKPRFIKNVVPILINEPVIASKVNTVNLTIPTGFTGLETGTVYYNGDEIPVDFSNNSFKLDLIDKLTDSNINLTLHVDETDTVMEYTYSFELNCIFKQISSASDLFVEMNAVDGCRVIELVSDVSLVSDIIINHDVKLIGNQHNVDLNNHSFIINEGVNWRVDSVLFNVGDPCIIQRLNSTLNATNCKFTNCISTNYNNNGSVILCDIDLESLSVDNDFTTILKNSIFINNHSCIFHGGQLSVDNCQYLNNDLDYVDKNNVAFLYQIDGEASIKNSIFDIDYRDETLCIEQKNIGSAQALFKCGLSAQVNTLTHDYLMSDEKALFCDAPFNNQAHLFAKYYYKNIETCVYSSPVPNAESRALCYMVTDVNKVFKENVRVTRVDSDLENPVNTMEWED